jgi:hypothetical protein
LDQKFANIPSLGDAARDVKKSLTATDVVVISTLTVVAIYVAVELMKAMALALAPPVPTYRLYFTSPDPASAGNSVV